MERNCSTGQSRQRAVAPIEEEEANLQALSSSPDFLKIFFNIW
jgi:hypothetical protein